jgi:hypothetical protein
MLAFPYGTFEGSFVTSLVMTLVHDAHHQGHIVHHGYYLAHETTNIPHGRNQIVRTFLNETDAEWLWFIDTDQTFDADTLDRMLASADPHQRPILGALVFSYSRGDAQEIVPTLWTVHNEAFVRITQIPAGEQYLTLAATGTGCVLIHRSVLEAVRDLPVPTRPEITFGQTAWPWFQYSDWINADGHPDVMGEDLTFFLRAAAAGYPTTVDTTIEVGHVKTTEITRASYERQPIAVAALPTFAVIPVRGQHHLTDALIGQLLDQGDVDAIFVLDNGAEENPYHHTDPTVHVIPSAGLNIHQMWNRGIQTATTGAPRCNIAILNNDLAIGSGFLSGLAATLRSTSQCLAVSPNYDRRPGTGFFPVSGICANRYDGTGGLAGFAFMIPGEMFAAGFPPFDETFEWWYGDNDFVLQIERFGGTYGIALDVTCAHLDGGSKTADSYDLAERIAADRARFITKWESA